MAVLARLRAPRLCVACRPAVAAGFGTGIQASPLGKNVPQRFTGYVRLCSSSSVAYTKHTHPREWAIFSVLDRDHDGHITAQETRAMCRRFDATECADVLVDLMDSSGDGFVTFEDFCRKFHLVSMVRKAARLKQWHRTYGLGVAGNVAGHMEQAGEAEASSEPSEAPTTPANVFTFYSPHPHTIDAPEHEVLEQLESFPVTNVCIDFPKCGSNVQVEPEMGLYVDIVYSVDQKSVERLVPRRIAAFNDCSIRQLEGSEKLSEKKNWGFGSKGISLRTFRVDSISKGSYVDQLVLTSYIKRDDKVVQYSVAAPARSYLMFHEPLMNWIVDRINNQVNTGKWEEIFSQFVKADYPTSMWIALGAGEYTEWGQKNFLKAQDECAVLIYDEKLYPDGPGTDIVTKIFEDRGAPEGIIHLHQTFI